MIRILSGTTCLAFLAFVLYLPSVYSPQRLIEQVHADQAEVIDHLGRDHAIRILSRMVAVQDRLASVPGAPGFSSKSEPIQGAVETSMARVDQRLRHNAYFQSIEALFLLASFRAATMMEWLPAILLFAPAVLLDGFILRIVKSKEFLQHDPEWFAMHACAAILLIGCTVAALFIPYVLPPILLPAAPLVTSILFARALACFHRQD